jgi:hypothetical protein
MCGAGEKGRKGVGCKRKKIKPKKKKAFVNVGLAESVKPKIEK